MSRIGDAEFVPDEWMVPYLEVLGGGSEVVRLCSGRRVRVDINGPLAVLQIGMAAQVGLLARLHRDGMLAVTE